MKTKRQILKISEIVIESKLYPRMEVDSETSKRYAEAMESGADFPPITVAERNKKYYLVDGKHRLDAYEINKKDIVDVEVLIGLTEKEIFIESVKRNIGHGRPFSEEDINEIKITLEDFNLGIEQVSEIVRIPITKLKPFVAKEIESHYDKEFSSLDENAEQQTPTDSSKLISTQNKELEEKREQWRLKNKYSLNNFLCFMYATSKRIDDFLINIEKYESLEDKDNQKEILDLLKRIDDVGKRLKNSKRFLTELTNKEEKEFKEIKKLKEEHEKDEERGINELLEDEKEYFDKKDIDDAFEED
jgi:hypothetical protein